MKKRGFFLFAFCVQTALFFTACSSVTIGDTPPVFEEELPVYQEVTQDPLIDTSASFSQSEINDLCQDLDNYAGGIHPDSVTPTVTSPISGQESSSRLKVAMLSSYAIFNSVYIELKLNPIGLPASFLRFDDGTKVLVNGRQLPYKESTSTNVGYYADYVDLRPSNKANICIIDDQGNIEFQQIRMPEAVTFINYRSNDTSPTFGEGVNIEFSPAYSEVRGNVCVEQCVLSYAIRPAAPGVMSFNFNTLRPQQEGESYNVQANPSDSIRRLHYSFRNALTEETPILGFGESNITGSTTESIYLYYPYIP